MLTERILTEILNGVMTAPIYIAGILMCGVVCIGLCGLAESYEKKPVKKNTEKKMYRHM